MTRTELFMEGAQVDLSDDVQALFTYAIDDVRQFGSRNTSFSKTINLPGTARNNAIFGHAFEVTGFNPHNPGAPNIGANFAATRAARALILGDGIQVFKGVLRLLEIVENKGVLEYQCAVFGELGGLMARLANKYLTDLDFSDYDTEYTTAAITASWTANTTTPGEDVYWPLIDYGVASTNKHDYDYTTFRPALYLKEYIERMIEATGYTYDCPFFDTTTFQRLIIPHNEDRLRRYSNRMLYNAQQSQLPIFVYKSTGATLTSASVSLPTVVFPGTMSGVGGSTSFIYNGTTPVRVRVIAQIGGWYDVNNVGSQGFNLAFAIEHAPSGSFTFSLVGTPGQLPLVSVGPYDPANAPTRYFSFVVDEEMTLNPGDHIRLRVYTSSSPAVPHFRVDLDAPVNLLAFADAVVSQIVVYGEDVFIMDCIPKNVRQTDVFLNVCKMFNLYVYEDPVIERHLHITPYPDFYAAVSDAIDWTEKVDRSAPISLKPMAELGARFYRFLYEDDSDYYNESYKKRQGEQYGSRIFDAGTDFAKGNKDVKLTFASTPIVGYSGEDKDVSSIFKRDSDGAEENMSSKPRVLLTKVIAGVSSWDIKNGSTVLTSTTSFPYAGHVDDPDTPTADMNFGALREAYWAPVNGHTGANLYNVGYSAYMAEITDKDSKLMTCSVRLTAVDIAQLDFSKLVIVDGALWRLNKVADFDPLTEKPTRVELLRVINLSY